MKPYLAPPGNLVYLDVELNLTNAITKSKANESHLKVNALCLDKIEFWMII